MARDSQQYRGFILPPTASASDGPSWLPPIDIYRVSDGWLVKLDLAGVRPEDVEVALAGDRLTIRGVRRDLFVEAGSQHYRMEIAYSPFERTIQVPQCSADSMMRIETHNGMFLIRLYCEGTIG